MNTASFTVAYVLVMLTVFAYLAWIERASVAAALFDQVFERVAMRRTPDFVVGEHADPYLQRWWLIPRNRLFNVYLHCFMRSDDDRALHDHPWHSVSLLLKGEAIEHTIAAGGVRHQRWLCLGDVRVRSARFAHRIELPANVVFGQGAPHMQPAMPCWTLFVTGPVLREWGFHCPLQGWIHWKRFTHPADKGLIGRGCDA
jgi:hypothetical protein